MRWSKLIKTSALWSPTRAAGFFQISVHKSHRLRNAPQTFSPVPPEPAEKIENTSHIYSDVIL